MIGIESSVGPVAAGDRTGDLRRQVRDVERLDPASAAPARHETSPGDVDPVAERGHHAEPGDDDAPHLRLLGGEKEPSSGPRRPARTISPSSRMLADLAAPAHRRETSLAEKSCEALYNQDAPPAIARPRCTTCAIEIVNSLRSFPGICPRRRRSEWFRRHRPGFRSRTPPRTP